MLATLFDFKKTGYPVITIVFALSCLIVSIPTLFLPGLYQVFGGYKPLNYPWQRFTLAFQHGFHGYPLILHLGFNFFLLWYCGILAEKILGSARYLLLTVAAMFSFALTHSLPILDGHGSSGVIWAYTPVVFFTLRFYKHSNSSKAEQDALYKKGWHILILMWVVITLAMALLPYLAGWRGNIFKALILGNAFHISATITGFICTFLWRRIVQQKLANLNFRNAFDNSVYDRLAIIASMLLPMSLTGILIWALMHKPSS